MAALPPGGVAVNTNHVAHRQLMFDKSRYENAYNGPPSKYGNAIDHRVDGHFVQRASPRKQKQLSIVDPQMSVYDQKRAIQQKFESLKAQLDAQKALVDKAWHRLSALKKENEELRKQNQYLQNKSRLVANAAPINHGGNNGMNGGYRVQFSNQGYGPNQVNQQQQQRLAQSSQYSNQQQQQQRLDQSNRSGSTMSTGYTSSSRAPTLNAQTPAWFPSTQPPMK